MGSYCLLLQNAISTKSNMPSKLEEIRNPNIICYGMEPPVTNANDSSCTEQEPVEFGATKVIKGGECEKTAVNAKTCSSKVEVDTTQYVWDYKNDENKDLGLEIGAVVHNREWSYGLIKYASLVQVAVAFKAKCTFSFKNAGTTRILKIVDDVGYIHGELEINIHAGTPCVCAVPKKEKIMVKDKVIRCPQKLSGKLPGECFVEAEPPKTEKKLVKSTRSRYEEYDVPGVEPEYVSLMNKEAYRLENLVPRLSPKEITKKLKAFRNERPHWWDKE